MSRAVTPAQKAAKAEYDRARRERLKFEIAEKKRAYYLTNKDKENARVATWVEANRERSREIKQGWKERNYVAPAPRTSMPAELRRARAVARVAAWREANPEKYAAQLAKPLTREQRQSRNAHSLARHRRTRQATPPWADRRGIKAIYLKAQEYGLTVDHIIPLKGKTVSGLHVPENLQFLTKSMNSMKGNRYAS